MPALRTASIADSFSNMAEQPRQATCWAAASPKAKLEPMCVECIPLGDNGVEVEVTHCGLCGALLGLDRSLAATESRDDC